MTEIRETIFKLPGGKGDTVINNIHLLKALAAEHPDENRSAKNWYLQYGDFDYPLKWAVARAAENATGESVDRGRFHTDDARRVAKELGFEIVEKKKEADQST